ncbi:MAG: hypothetical protein ACPG7E_01540 [Marinirhabdus sp.]
MNFIIKTALFGTIAMVGLHSCIIQNPAPGDCVKKEITVTKVEAGTAYDLVLKEANGDRYYINRGLENGMTVNGASGALLNKKVTLHLYKFWFGAVSGHISQLQVNGKIRYTEF